MLAMLKQIRTVISIELPEKSEFFVCLFACCLRSITAHYACLSLARLGPRVSVRSMFFLFFFEEETYNYFRKRELHETAPGDSSQRTAKRAREALHSLSDLAESYRNWSNADFACHYASRFSAVPSTMQRDALQCVIVS